MKSIGIIRKIDDLGRLVIPKEVRNNLNIEDGEKLEIFTDKDSIIVKKSSSIQDELEFATKLCGILSYLMKYDITVTDKIKITSAKKMKEFTNKKDISSLENELNKLIFNR